MPCLLPFELSSPSATYTLQSQLITKPHKMGDFDITHHYIATPCPSSSVSTVTDSANRRYLITLKSEITSPRKRRALADEDISVSTYAQLQETLTNITVAFEEKSLLTGEPYKLFEVDHDEQAFILMRAILKGAATEGASVAFTKSVLSCAFEDLLSRVQDMDPRDEEVASSGTATNSLK